MKCRENDEYSDFEDGDLKEYVEDKVSEIGVYSFAQQLESKYYRSGELDRTIIHFMKELAYKVKILEEKIEKLTEED